MLRVRCERFLDLAEKGKKPQVVGIDLAKKARIHRWDDPDLARDQNPPQCRSIVRVNGPKRVFEVQGLHAENQVNCLLQSVLGPAKLL